MDLEVLVGVLIGLLSVAESSLNVTESLSVAGSEGSGESLLEPDSMLAMSFTSTSSSAETLVPLTTQLTSLTISTMAASPSTLFLPVTSSPTPTPFPSSGIPSPAIPSSAIYITHSLPHLFTPTPTHSSSSSLQVPSSALLLTVSSPSSSNDITFQPVATPSPTHHVTPSDPPLLPPTNSSEPTHLSNDIPLTFVLPGAVVGGVLVVVVFPLLAIMVCVLIGRRRRKKKDHQMYSVTAHKDLYTFTAEENEQECIDLLSTSTEVSHNKTFNFAITTDTFGINLGCPDVPAGEDGGNLPALIFINAVDPAIPVSSNTLPTRRKAKANNSGADLRSHFENLSSSKDTGKGYRSMENVNQGGGRSTEKLLTQDCRLKQQESTKPKANNNDHFPGKDDTKPTSLFTTNPKNDSNGYSMEPLCSSKMATFKDKPERESLYTGPKETLKTSLEEMNLNDNSPGIEVETFKTCTSHYDVPKRLIEGKTRLAASDDGKLGDMLQEATNTPKKDGSMGVNMDANKKGTSQPTNSQTFITQNNVIPALGGTYKAPTKPTTSFTHLGERLVPSSVREPEGGLSKPKTSPTNLTTTISSENKNEGNYDVPKSLLRSAEPIVKLDDIGGVNVLADALETSAYQNASAGIGTSTEASAEMKPQLLPKPVVKPPPVAKVKPKLPSRQTATQKGHQIV